MPSQRLTTAAAVIVLALWVVTTVDGMLTHDYEAVQIVTPIMMTLSGYLFARDFFGALARRRKGGE